MRPWSRWRSTSQKIDSYDTELVKKFFVAVANNSGPTLQMPASSHSRGPCAWLRKWIPTAPRAFPAIRVRGNGRGLKRSGNPNSYTNIAKVVLARRNRRSLDAA